MQWIDPMLRGLLDDLEGYGYFNSQKIDALRHMATSGLVGMAQPRLCHHEMLFSRTKGLFIYINAKILNCIFHIWKCTSGVRMGRHQQNKVERPKKRLPHH